MELHPEIIEQDGKATHVKLPYAEFEQLQQLLADAQDLVDLREAKAAEADTPGVDLQTAREELQS